MSFISQAGRTWLCSWLPGLPSTFLPTREENPALGSSVQLLAVITRWHCTTVSPPSTSDGHSSEIQPFLRSPLLGLPPAAPCQSYELIPLTIVLLNIWVPDREKQQKKDKFNSIWASPHCTGCGCWWAWLYNRGRTKNQREEKSWAGSGRGRFCVERKQWDTGKELKEPHPCLHHSPAV